MIIVLNYCRFSFLRASRNVFFGRSTCITFRWPRYPGFAVKLLIHSLCSGVSPSYRISRIRKANW